MSTYRVGNHQPQNVYRADQYIGVMFTAEDASLVVEALNGRAEGFGRWCENETNEKCSGLEALEARKAEPCIGICSGCTPECHLAGDSCSCPFPSGADPACPVHQGRRARGPKPPPLGPGCICDGSGRTCPRHGAVL